MKLTIRKVVLKRIDIPGKPFALCDAETGCVLPSQVKTQIISCPDEPVRVIVEFSDFGDSEDFIIEA